jgi:hypothetical protein
VAAQTKTTEDKLPSDLGYSYVLSDENNQVDESVALTNEELARDLQQYSNGSNLNEFEVTVGGQPLCTELTQPFAFCQDD